LSVLEIIKIKNLHFVMSLYAEVLRDL
jgi:hypothetical protein